jgi:hypothetical protein
MSVPPRTTDNEPAGWEVAGEQPARRGRAPKPDRMGSALVSLVVIALVVGLLLLFVL